MTIPKLRAGAKYHRAQAILDNRAAETLLEISNPPSEAERATSHALRKKAAWHAEFAVDLDTHADGIQAAGLGAQN